MISLKLHKQLLPAGLEDKGVEFYLFENEIKCLHDGKVFKWGEFPDWIIKRISDDLMEHPEALKALYDWDLKQQDEMIKQYIICRFGGFDNDPDIDCHGNISHTEYFDCGRRGQCKQEGKLCSTIKVENGYLTKQEIAVIKLVASNKLNKEIADILCISEETVSSHNQNIQSKLNVENKLGMAIWAHGKNII